MARLFNESELIIATHNPGLASRMDRIARLEDGHLIET